MSVFPMTSMTLLQKIAVEITGEREAAWIRFILKLRIFSCYEICYCK